MDNVTKALNAAVKRIDPHDEYVASRAVAIDVARALAQSLPPTMTVAELAAAIEKERADGTR